MSLEKESIIAEQENVLAQEDDLNELPPNDIVAYNELRSCADLVRMHQQLQLVIDPEFQRDFVWPNTAQTRFIDSLIKQLPIPSMCISLDYKSQNRFVIDGLQRISTIIKFLTDDSWTLSNLDDIDSKISGKDVAWIKTKYSNLYERVENLVIPITVIRCDYSKNSHMNYLFTIFHRLNTGGSRLNNQEIRNCIYNGSFNSMLKNLANEKNFDDILGIKNSRFDREEILLRFLAFEEKYEQYNGKLATFLNDYMKLHKDEKSTWISDKSNLFLRVTSVTQKSLAHSVSRYKFSKTLLEGILVGIARNINIVEIESPNIVESKIHTLINDNLFSVQMLSEGLAKRERVVERLAKAQEIMSK